MNPFRKAYCRIFQEVFHFAIPFLPYRKPKRLSHVEDLPALFAKKHITSVLLVTDESIRSHGITAPLEQALTDAGIHCAVYDKTVANPTTENVEEAKDLFLAGDCQALIGFGGGSSIDCAKAVGVRIVKPKTSLGQLEGILKVHHKLPFFVAIPTTAGTGSETTVTAVITDAKTRHKYPFSDFCLIPHYAVLDAKVTYTLPPSLTATTGMDALTHAVEAYIGRSTTHGTRKDATKAVQLIFDNIQTAYENGSDKDARKRMLYAAYLAGSVFSKSYVGYVHAVAHSLGGKYNIPHGLANAVLLPYVLTSYEKAAEKKLHKLAIAVGLSAKEEAPHDGAAKFIDAIWQMQKDLNVGNKLSGINPADIPELSAYADKEANPLYPVPVLMNAKELERFYYDVMEDTL